jgi:hypothetical protein
VFLKPGREASGIKLDPGGVVSEWIRVGPAAHCPPGWFPFVSASAVGGAQLHGPTIAATAGMIAPTGTRLTISRLIVAVRHNRCGGIISLR